MKFKINISYESKRSILLSSSLSKDCFHVPLKKYLDSQNWWTKKSTILRDVYLVKLGLPRPYQYALHSMDSTGVKFTDNWITWEIHSIVVACIKLMKLFWKLLLIYLLWLWLAWPETAILNLTSADMLCTYKLDLSII